MAEHASERARFTEPRARALTNVLLSGRNDLTVQDLSSFDYGIDYLVTVHSENPGLRQFAVELRATHSPVTAETANNLLKPTMQAMARHGPFPYPTVLFYFTVMESQSWYTWVMQPVSHKDGTMTLEMQEAANCRNLDEEGLNRIVACVNQWYDFFFQRELGKQAARPAHIEKTGGRLVRPEVVIKGSDSILFDYSETLLQMREQFAAAKQCSSYILKTYPSPLPTLKGLWDRQGDMKRRAVITLTVTDTITKRSVTARFTPKDIQSPTHVYEQFKSLVGEALNPR